MSELVKIFSKDPGTRLALGEIYFMIFYGNKQASA